MFLTSNKVEREDLIHSIFPFLSYHLTLSAQKHLSSSIFFCLQPSICRAIFDVLVFAGHNSVFMIGFSFYLYYGDGAHRSILFLNEKWEERRSSFMYCGYIFKITIKLSSSYNLYIVKLNLTLKCTNLI